MTHIIAEPCVGVKDKACVDVCPVDCIYDKDEWEACIDACPVQAIFPLEEVPDKWSEWIAKNYVAFDLEAP
jgi:NAD-dependent dihydropyrimidine dehydrogenase PreA subunit